jgi:hypothetical protein
LANLVALDGLCEGDAQDLAAMAGSTLGVEGVSNTSIGDRRNGRVVDFLIGRGIATGIRDVVPDGGAVLVDANGALQYSASVRLYSVL